MDWAHKARKQHQPSTYHLMLLNASSLSEELLQCISILIIELCYIVELDLLPKSFICMYFLITVRCSDLLSSAREHAYIWLMNLVLGHSG